MLPCCMHTSCIGYIKIRHPFRSRVNRQCPPLSREPSLEKLFTTKMYYSENETTNAAEEHLCKVSLSKSTAITVLSKKNKEWYRHET